MEKILNKIAITYSKQNYLVCNDYSEQRVCFNKLADQYEVCLFERGQKFEVFTTIDEKEAVLKVLQHLSDNKAQYAAMVIDFESLSSEPSVTQQKK